MMSSGEYRYRSLGTGQLQFLIMRLLRIDDTIVILKYNRRFVALFTSENSSRARPVADIPAQLTSGSN